VNAGAVNAGAPARLRGLTSLRFLAACVVVLHHLPLAMPALASVLLVAKAGYVGVTFFFVLSGFVLAYGWTGASSAREFYARRIARVYPVHVLTAIAVLLMLLRGGVDWGALPVNLALLQAWSPDPAVYLSFVGAAWSLSCEVFFYACFPLLFGLLARCVHHARWVIALVTGAAALGALFASFSSSLGEYLYHLPLFRMVDFSVGILLCMAMRRGWRVSVRPVPAAALVVTCYLLVTMAQVLGRANASWSWLFSLSMVLPFGLLIASVAGREIDGGRSILASRVPVLLGLWSFALYMVHGVILAAVEGHVRDLQGAAAVVVGIAIFALAITASWLLYALYEHPVESALRRRWIRSSPAEQGAAVRGASAAGAVARDSAGWSVQS